MTIYHFVGIKGSGMSALAQILHDMGFEVQGSDVEKQFFTQQALRKSRELKSFLLMKKILNRDDHHCRKCFS